MHSRYKAIITILFIFSLFMSSCVDKTSVGSKNVEEIFSLNTVPCKSICPVFDLSLYGDKTLIFVGKENTSLSGKHKKVLTDDQFEALLGIIETADWANLDNSYKTNSEELPTQRFTYARNGINASLSRYSGGPESISNMADTILKFAETQVFND